MAEILVGRHRGSKHRTGTPTLPLPADLPPYRKRGRRDLAAEDAGILSFGKKGEERYGLRNFLELLFVFTSPPLFRVVSGQKELGHVHESTFYTRYEGGPFIVLGGRSWETKHIDWKRRVAYVEATDEKGRSSWIGEGQFLSFQVCRAIRSTLASDRDSPLWSQRAHALNPRIVFVSLN